LGGVAGALLGGFATAGYAHLRHWSAVVPGTSLAAAVAAALALGAVAGVYPALRAARLSPAEALPPPTQFVIMTIWPSHVRQHLDHVILSMTLMNRIPRSWNSGNERIARPVLR